MTLSNVPSHNCVRRDGSIPKVSTMFGLTLSLSAAFFPGSPLRAQEKEGNSPPNASSIEPSLLQRTSGPEFRLDSTPRSRPQSDPALADAIYPTGSPLDWLVSGAVSGVIKGSFTAVISKLFGSGPMGYALKESSRTREFNLIDPESEALMQQLKSLRDFQQFALSTGRTLSKETLDQIRNLIQTLHARETIGLENVHQDQRHLIPTTTPPSPVSSPTPSPQRASPTRNEPREVREPRDRPCSEPIPKKGSDEPEPQTQDSNPAPKPETDNKPPPQPENDPSPPPEPPRILGMPRPDDDGTPCGSDGGHPPRRKSDDNYANGGQSDDLPKCGNEVQPRQKLGGSGEPPSEDQPHCGNEPIHGGKPKVGKPSNSGDPVRCPEPPRPPPRGWTSTGSGGIRAFHSGDLCIEADIGVGKSPAGLRGMPGIVTFPNRYLPSLTRINLTIGR